MVTLQSNPSYPVQALPHIPQHILKFHTFYAEYHRGDVPARRDDPNLTKLLKRGALPKAVIENFKLADRETAQGVAFQHVMETLTHRIFPSWNLKEKPIRFFVSDDLKANAFVIRDTRPPVIGITKGILCGRDEELASLSAVAAILKHELQHIILGDNYHGKLTEEACDLSVIVDLDKAELDPRAMLKVLSLFAKNRNRSLLDDLFALLDAHPIPHTRIEAFESVLTAYERGYRDIERPLGEKVSDAALHKEIASIAMGAKHVSFISQLKEAVHWGALSFSERVEVLAEYLRVEKYSSDERVSELRTLFYEIRDELNSKENARSQDLIARGIQEYRFAERSLFYRGIDTEHAQYYRAHRLYCTVFSESSVLGHAVDLQDTLSRVAHSQNSEELFTSSVQLQGLMRRTWTLCAPSLGSSCRMNQVIFGAEGIAPAFSTENLKKIGHVVPWQPLYEIINRESDPERKSVMATGLYLVGVVDVRVIQYIDFKFVAEIFPVASTLFDSSCSGTLQYASKALSLDEEGVVKAVKDESEEQIGENDKALLLNPTVRSVTSMLLGDVCDSFDADPSVVCATAPQAESFNYWMGKALRNSHSGQERVIEYLEEQRARLSPGQFKDYFERVLGVADVPDMRLYPPYFRALENSGPIEEQPLFKYIQDATPEMISSRAKLTVYLANSRVWRDIGFYDKGRWKEDLFCGGTEGNPLYDAFVEQGRPFEKYVRDEVSRLTGTLSPHGVESFKELCASIPKVHVLLQKINRFRVYRFFEPTYLYAFQEAQSLIDQGNIPTLGEICELCSTLKAQREIPRWSGYQSILRSILSPALKTLSWDSAPHEALHQWATLSESKLVDQIALDKELPTLLARIHESPIEEQVAASARLVSSSRPASSALEKQAEDAFAAAVLALLGKDDGGEEYQNAFGYLVLPLLRSAKGMRYSSVLQNLAAHVEAQPSLMHMIERVSLKKQKSELAGDDEYSMLGVDLINLSSQSTRARTYEILKKPLTPDSRRELINNLNLPGQLSKIHRDMPGEELRRLSESWADQIHEEFWKSPLPVRAVGVRALLFPPSSESKPLFARLRDDAFPPSMGKLPSELGWIYINRIPGHQRATLFALTLATKNPYESGSLSVGHLLGQALPLLGPAETKLSQAIQSIPDLDPQIALDMSSVKSEANPPLRSEIISQFENLPHEVRSQVKHLGRMVGSGSFYVSVEVTLIDGRRGVLQLLRPGAGYRSAQGMVYLRDTAEIFFKGEGRNLGVSPELVSSVLTSTERQWQRETDYRLGTEQFAVAQKAYAGLTVSVGERTFSFSAPKIMKLNGYGDAIGPGFKIVEFVEGVEFVKLKRDSLQIEELVIKAQAIAAVELARHFAGLPSDEDCTDGNVKCKDDAEIGRLDFGGFSTTQVPESELFALGKIVAQARKSENVVEGFLSAVAEYRKEHGSLPTAVLRFQKALLSQCDFLSLLSQEQKKGVVIAAVKKGAPAFLKGLGLSTLEKAGLRFIKTPVVIHDDWFSSRDY